MNNRKKILVLMSGGVDSSVAAALLHAQGYQVTGVYLKLWESTGGDRVSDPTETRSPNIGDPCWAAEMRDAARVAAHLGVPFEVWDVTEDYKKRVLQNFYSEYAAGRTPNPDVLCNSEIKFGVALERALRKGYDYVATGHYARVSHVTCNTQHVTQDSNLLHATCYMLHAGRDSAKDQSYFLWRLTQEQLARVIFPIGDYTKPQVRQMAKKFGLHNAEKKDSQGVCFLGKIELKEFLYGTTPPPAPPQRGREIVRFPRLSKEGIKGWFGVRQSGPIVDVRGNLLGYHDGLAHFTVGQRHGVNIGDGHGPYFVVEKDLDANALIVANEIDEPKYRAVQCTVRDVQFHDSYFMTHDSFTCMARTRYRAPLVSVILRRQPKDPVTKNTGFFAPLRSAQNDDKLNVQFKEPQRAVAPGQSIVFYAGDQVIGGGVIDQVILQNALEISNIQYPISNKISNAQILPS